MAHDKAYTPSDSDPMRILVLTRQFPREGNPTAGVFILRQIQSLVRNGADVRVISPVPWIPKGVDRLKISHRYAQKAAVVDFEGIRVYYPRYFRPPLGRYSHIVTPYFLELAVRPILSEILKAFHPHVLHAFWAVPEGYWGLLSARRTHLPLVVSLMGSDVHTEPKRNRMVSRMLSKVLRGADRVTSVSHALRLQAEAIAEPPREIEVIYNGCDTKAFTFNPVGRRRIRGELRISTGEVAIIYVGSLLRTKGVYEMLQALQLSNQSGRSIRLIVVGAGKEKGKLERFAAASGVSDRISFLGQVPHAHIVHLLSASDILALPSYNEGLPNIVLEAMACGLPVIATDVGGIPEAVEDGRSGILVPPREVAPLVQAVDCLVLDPERRRRMGLRGRAIVESKFKWENTAAGFKEVYRSLLIE